MEIISSASSVVPGESSPWGNAPTMQAISCVINSSFGKSIPKISGSSFNTPVSEKRIVLEGWIEERKLGNDRFLMLKSGGSFGGTCPFWNNCSMRPMKRLKFFGNRVSGLIEMISLFIVWMYTFKRPLLFKMEPNKRRRLTWRMSGRPRFSDPFKTCMKE